MRKVTEKLCASRLEEMTFHFLEAYVRNIIEVICFMHSIPTVVQLDLIYAWHSHSHCSRIIVFFDMIIIDN